MSDLGHLKIWDDPAIRESLSWYLEVAENPTASEIPVCFDACHTYRPARRQLPLLDGSKQARLLGLRQSIAVGAKRLPTSLPSPLSNVKYCRSTAMLPRKVFTVQWFCLARSQTYPSRDFPRSTSMIAAEKTAEWRGCAEVMRLRSTTTGAIIRQIDRSYRGYPHGGYQSF
jgi:hypothetical protein